MALALPTTSERTSESGWSQGYVAIAFILDCLNSRLKGDRYTMILLLYPLGFQVFIPEPRYLTLPAIKARGFFVHRFGLLSF